MQKKRHGIARDMAALRRWIEHAVNGGRQLIIGQPLQHIAHIDDESAFGRRDGEPFALTRQQLLDEVWGAEPDVYSNVVDLYVHYLRKKFEEAGFNDLLKTVRGVGYRLADAPKAK